MPDPQFRWGDLYEVRWTMRVEGGSTELHARVFLTAQQYAAYNKDRARGEPEAVAARFGLVPVDGQAVPTYAPPGAPPWP